ncbi:MAG: hypothetical protein HYV77_03665 [Candidatus Wildermuthbacteria bacterium]|nr:hypothetical protein [Candidatus Wildermuthbacteria bacterium]
MILDELQTSITADDTDVDEEGSEVVEEEEEEEDDDDDEESTDSPTATKWFAEDGEEEEV